jgi:hypothetical protein
MKPSTSTSNPIYEQRLLDAMLAVNGTARLTIREWMPLLKPRLPEISDEDLANTIMGLGAKHVLIVVPRRYGLRSIPETVDVE